MALVRLRTQQEVVDLLLSILRDVQTLEAHAPESFHEWRGQADFIDAWVSVTLSNVADLLPDEVRHLVRRIQQVQEVVLYRDPASFC